MSDPFLPAIQAAEARAQAAREEYADARRAYRALIAERDEHVRRLVDEEGARGAQIAAEFGASRQLVQQWLVKGRNAKIAA